MKKIKLLVPAFTLEVEIDGDVFTVPPADNQDGDTLRKIKDFLSDKSTFEYRSIRKIADSIGQSTEKTESLVDRLVDNGTVEESGAYPGYFTLL